MDPVIFQRNFYGCRIDAIVRILLKIDMKFLGCLNSSELFDYGAYVDHDPDPGFFNRIFTTSVSGQ